MKISKNTVGMNHNGQYAMPYRSQLPAAIGHVMTLAPRSPSNW
jgi:hypothetical protein